MSTLRPDPSASLVTDATRYIRQCTEDEHWISDDNLELLRRRNHWQGICWYVLTPLPKCPIMSDSNSNQAQLSEINGTVSAQPQDGVSATSGCGLYKDMLLHAKGLGQADDEGELGSDFSWMDAVDHA